MLPRSLRDYIRVLLKTIQLSLISLYVPSNISVPMQKGQVPVEDWNAWDSWLWLDLLPLNELYVHLDEISADS